jgi:uncharacterized protein YjbI with pentapeptide repeats
LKARYLSETHLDRINLSEANLYTAVLFRADLSGADLRRANLTEAHLKEVNLSGANLNLATLREARLFEAELSGADLSGADLRGANLSRANLIGANLREAGLSGANLSDATLIRANLSGADLRRADFNETNLTEANLIGASLHQAVLVGTVLTRANLTGCYVHGFSVWDVQLEEAIQSSLVITPLGDPTITVDNLEVAQFIYLLLNNQKIRHVIDTITSKVVLILGRFTPERKAIFDAIRDELRRRDYVPILFDFEKPSTKSTLETVSTLAHMARFVIADLTHAKSVLQELQAVVPTNPTRSHPTAHPRFSI